MVYDAQGRAKNMLMIIKMRNSAGVNPCGFGLQSAAKKPAQIACIQFNGLPMISRIIR